MKNYSDADGKDSNSREGLRCSIGVILMNKNLAALPKLRLGVQQTDIFLVF